jgi:ABC-2 type transport system ATP-binding protein
MHGFLEHAMLEIRHVTKMYDAKRALDDFSMSVECGESVAIIGPNGARKTTLFEIIGGIIPPDSGTCRFDGVGLAALPLSTLGYVAQSPYYYDSFSALEMLGFERTVRGIEYPDSELDKLVREFCIQDFSGVRMGDLSGGMPKRVSLACAFMGEPKVIVLDEPLNDIDIQTMIVLKRKIAEAKERGACLLVSSHVLDFFGDTVDRLIFIDKGRAVRELRCGGGDPETVYEKLFLPR